MSSNSHAAMNKSTHTTRVQASRVGSAAENSIDAEIGTGGQKLMIHTLQQMINE